MKPVVAVDIDGVLADFVGGFSRWAEVEPDITVRDLGLQIDRFQDLHDTFIAEDGYKDLAVYPGARAYVQAMEFLQYRVRLVTARPIEARAQTLYWVRNLGIGSPIIHTRGRPKHKALRDNDLYAISAIDDNPEDLVHHRQTCQTFLRKHAWNEYAWGSFTGITDTMMENSATQLKGHKR